MNPQILRSNNFVREAAEFILQQARAALGERDEFRIALSGGRTPRPVYEELARAGGDLPWERVFITFGDERCVPPDDEQSNYRMARESLLLPAAVPERSVARLRGEIDPQLAAQEYEDQLNVLAVQKGEMTYRHDLILLGLGDDGHTASLFPGTAALEETTRNVTANFVPKFDAWRLTFTIPLIAHARKVCFLVDGSKHRDLLEKVLQPDSDYPATRVQNASPDVTWIIGEAAAG
ncbi:MAG TPA: 6-phosphogluconolactonase [Chthoniobacterales bacterium]|nr:6-phosphogluconolactonase [Chthoniobacterales bacterium]